jgi:DNA-binding HxlR family transcriptional regulator
MSLHKCKADGSQSCPIRDVLDRVGDRWSMLVLCTLAKHGTMRFSVLKRQIEDISQRMLAQTLRRLEQDGLLSRKVHPSVPPRVEYALTALGESLLSPIHALVSWAKRNHRRVRAARRAYVPPLRQGPL